MKKLIIAAITILFVTTATAQKIKRVSNYQIVFVNLKDVKVFDKYRFVGLTTVDNLQKLIAADNKKNSPIHNVNAVNTIKGKNNIIDGNK